MYNIWEKRQKRFFCLIQSTWPLLIEKNTYIKLHLLFLLAVQQRTMTSQLVVSNTMSTCEIKQRLQSKHSKAVWNHHVQKRPRLDQLDNGSYSTIQPTTFTTYNMKIGVWPAILKFFDFWVKNWSGLHTKIITKLVKKLNNNHWIGSSSPVINPSGVLTNINLT